jgi:fructose-1,6-bisphosphatase/inositol monophosphatase family enzyme
VEHDQILQLFDELADAVIGSLGDLSDWELSGDRPTQYRHDVVVDELILPRLSAAGFAVLSEESGLVGRAANGYTVVVDPVDGSTNASRGLPWFATSLCAVDGGGPAAALVVNLASGERFRALRGQGVETTNPMRSVAAAGSDREGRVWRPGPGGSGCRDIGSAIIGVSGLPPEHGGWDQFRALGAAALDLCAVATGRLDGFIDIDRAHGVWDFLGAALICAEAGVLVADGNGEELVVLDPQARRSPVAAATPELLAQLLELVSSWTIGP